MTTTPHLALPLIAAAQAMKHVTHNEALARLDALVQCAVVAEAEDAPAEPEAGARLLVSAMPAGAFAGQAGAIALYDAGVWRFLVPRAGWRVYVAATDTLLVHDGTAWRPLADFVPVPEELPRLGIGTAPDALNRLAAKLNAALFAALTVTEGGTGDLRFVLNKEGAGATVSQLYQSGFGGRAETGLMSDDDFRIRVSADGATWRDAVHLEAATGAARFPGGLPGLAGGWRNLLINPHLAVNQRGFAGGALAAGAYGFDRWKAGAGGATLSRAWEGTMTLEGAIEQVIEAPDLRGETVTLSVEDPSAALDVAIGADPHWASGGIAAGAGRRGVALQVPWEAFADVTVRISAPAEATFRRVQLEVGNVPGAWERRPIAVEEALCRRYFWMAGLDAGNRTIGTTAGLDDTHHQALVTFHVAMRAQPTCVPSGAGDFALAVDDATGWAERTLTLLEFLEASREAARFRLSTGIVTPRGRAGHWRAYGSGRLPFDAEL
ncbi:DUF2793 domain-containing protein [Salinarimonas sp. NSM]|uniref:DUF2793 domain-containing protein n=1 Tax=Salinarimonas sp. NSM TaxID=3458003 RepID=UPI0040365084